MNNTVKKKWKDKPPTGRKYLQKACVMCLVTKGLLSKIAEFLWLKKQTNKQIQKTKTMNNPIKKNRPKTLIDTSTKSSTDDK